MNEAMLFTAKWFAHQPGAEVLSMPFPEARIAHIWVDTRWMGARAEGVFFALKGLNHDGHHFVSEAIEAGVKTVVVQDADLVSPEWNVNVILSENPLLLMQELAAARRNLFSGMLAAVTGSNGKTTVKEWAWQLLVPDFSIARNPGSFNSQTGVPLALWTLESEHQLAVFEAGISRPGEMERHAHMLRPDIGLLTRMGDAHDAWFTNFEAKLREKLKLFYGVKTFIYLADDPLVRPYWHLFPESAEKISYGQVPDADLKLLTENGKLTGFEWKKQYYAVDGPLDDAAVENTGAALALAIAMGGNPVRLAERVRNLRTPALRLEVRHGQKGFTLLTDVYSFDLVSLRRALALQKSFANRGPLAAVFTDFPGDDHAEKEALGRLVADFSAGGLSQIFWIGQSVPQHLPLEKVQRFDSVSAAFYAALQTLPEKTVLLVKGARKYRLEEYLYMLEAHHAISQMEIDMHAVIQNLWHFRNLAGPGTRLMVMTKAGAYGTGDLELAQWLQTYGADYLAVAQVDEGIRLRRNGIRLPVMVLNVHEQALMQMPEFELEPEIYSLNLLKKCLEIWEQQNAWRIPLHLKWNTGMNRLGLDAVDIPEAIKLIKQYPNVNIASVFSHLMASDDPEKDVLTLKQLERFHQMRELFIEKWKKPFLSHIANTGAIHRFPQARLDMVRLGIGLYGYATAAEDAPFLREAIRCTTRVLQLREVPAGETVGYGGEKILDHPTRIATLGIGYADGFPRNLGEGKGQFLIRGQICPVVGKVCMDVLMVDVTTCEAVEEGDTALWFGPSLSLKNVARQSGTIPYELLTRLGNRVERIYTGEF